MIKFCTKAPINFNIPPTDAVPDLTGYTHILLQNEIPLESTVNHLLAASEKKVTSYFNASPMLSPDQIREFPWKALSWLIVNEGELGLLLKAFNILIPDLTLSTRDNARKGIMALHKCAAFHQGVSIICTLGELGVLYFRSGGEVQYLDSAEPRNPVKDTTGVGDCFTGSFVARMALGDVYNDRPDPALWYAVTMGIIVSMSSVGTECGLSELRIGVGNVCGERWGDGKLSDPSGDYYEVLRESNGVYNVKLAVASSLSSNRPSACA